MKISELQNGTEITFEVYYAGKKIEFSSVLKTKKWGKAYFEPIRVNGKVLVVQKEDVKINMILLVENDKPILWRDLKMKAIVYRRTVYYRADVEAVGKPYNRRKAYRQYVGDDVKVQPGAGIMDIPGILRDISTKGFSVICYEKIPEPEEKFLYVSYVYKDENVEFDLKSVGRFVREQELGQGKFLYACVMASQNPEVEKFIHYKQKEQMNARSKEL